MLREAKASDQGCFSRILANS